MSTKKRKPLTTEDGEVREWTAADFARAKTFDELPKSLQATLATRRRGPQKAPTKLRTSLRLSTEVVEHFKGGGPGWQTRIDATLRELIAKPAARTRAAAAKRGVSTSARKAARPKPGVRRGTAGQKSKR